MASPALLRSRSPPSWPAAAVAARASANPLPPLSSPPPRPGRGRVRIAVVGDVHNDWTLEEDSRALHFLQPDLVLFTGDYGNENVQLVKSISELQLPKAAILGNHDCWHTYQFSEKKVDRVRLQLERKTCIIVVCPSVASEHQTNIKEAGTILKSKKNLGEQHVGYKCLDFPAIKLSVVGGRPFSCGGNRIFRPKLLSKWYDVNDMAESAKKIYDAAANAPEGHAVILLAHNGPTGLGSRIDDICGRDWIAGGGDHGDPDLEQAISDLQRETGVSIPLVVFGHMHKSLAYGRGLRKMIAFGANQTIYLNGAVVPRVKHAQSKRPAITTGEQTGLEGLGLMVPTSRAFTIVDLSEGAVEKISEVWVTVSDARTELEQEIVLYKQPREHI